MLQLVVGVGMGYLTSPLLTVSLAKVDPADASDASGVLTTASQIAQVLGIAAFGSVYLSDADGGGMDASAHGIYVTALIVVSGAVIAGLAALRLPGRR